MPSTTIDGIDTYYETQGTGAPILMCAPGGCMGCSVALAFGVDYPQATRGLVLHWPVGGHRWKVNCQERFLRHYNFVKQNGLLGVVERARGGKSFWTDSEGGPWATEIARN